jgi:hypothetical protein
MISCSVSDDHFIKADSILRFLQQIFGLFFSPSSLSLSQLLSHDSHHLRCPYVSFAPHSFFLNMFSSSLYSFVSFLQFFVSVGFN